MGKFLLIELMLFVLYQTSDMNASRKTQNSAQIAQHFINFLPRTSCKALQLQDFLAFSSFRAMYMELKQKQIYFQYTPVFFRLSRENQASIAARTSTWNLKISQNIPKIIFTNEEI